MPLPVWLPFALKAGSMVSSGIGNYLEGKNQERYSQRVMRMQQEAMRKREESERKAGAANIWFGLAGRAPMQPIYQKTPEIDPYEKSGAGRIWGGIGKGLSYAATAVSAYDTIRNTMIAQAEQAGVKAGASRLPEAMSKAQPAISVTDAPIYGEAVDRLPGLGERGFDAIEGSIIPSATVTSFKPVEHYSEVLTHLGNTTSDSEGLFSGWFADARKEAYDRGFNTSKGSLLKDYQGKLIDTMSDQREFELAEAKFENLQSLQKAQLKIQQETLQAAKDTKELTREAAILRRQETQQRALTDVRGSLIKKTATKGDIIHDSNRTVLVYDDMLHGALEHNGITVENGVYKVAADYQNTMSAYETDKLIKTLLRLSSDEAINESDIIRLDNSAESWGEGIGKWFRNLRHGWSELTEGEQITKVAEFKENLTSDNLAAILNMVHSDKQYLQMQVIAPQIGLEVGAIADQWKGNLNLLGITNPEEFEANLSNMLTRKFLPNLDLTTLDIKQTAKVSLVDTANTALDVHRGVTEDVVKGAGKQVVPSVVTPETISVDAASKAAKIEFFNIQKLKTAPGTSSYPAFPAKGNLYSKRVAEFTAKYGSYPDPETPILSWIDDKWGEFKEGRIRSPLGFPGGTRISADDFLSNTYSKASGSRSRYQTEHINPLTVGALDQRVEEGKLKDAALLAGLQSYTQTMKDSNYKWGQALFNPQMRSGMFPMGGLSSEFDPAMMNIAPGTGNFPVSEGISRVGAAIGLGGAYGNIAPAMQGAPTIGGPGRTNQLIHDSGRYGADRDWFSPQYNAQYLSRAREEWNRVQQEQISGRYQGRGGRFAPVPRYGR